ncbi:PEP-CTERM sorting domain-containing protein [Thermoleptolyngbya sp.]
MHQIYAVDSSDPALGGLDTRTLNERSPYPSDHLPDSLLPTVPNAPLRSSILNTLVGSLGAIALSLSATVEPAAAFSFNSRQSAYDLSFSQPDFADALAAYRITYDTVAERGDLITLDTQLKASAQNFVGLPSGSNTIASVTQSGNVFTHFIVSSGGPGGFEIRYDTPVATAPGGSFVESWLVRSFDGADWDLEFLGGGSNTGLIPPDYELAIAIPGNWSTQGTNPGQLEFRGIQPGYTILDNFSYNPATNLTTFKAVSNRWDGSSPDLNFVLHGGSAQSTPEPGVLLGLAALGGMIVRLRRPRWSR